MEIRVLAKLVVDNVADEKDARLEDFHAGAVSMAKTYDIDPDELIKEVGAILNEMAS